MSAKPPPHFKLGDQCMVELAKAEQQRGGVKRLPGRIIGLPTTSCPSSFQVDAAWGLLQRRVNLRDFCSSAASFENVPPVRSLEDAKACTPNKAGLSLTDAAMLQTSATHGTEQSTPRGCNCRAGNRCQTNACRCFRAGAKCGAYCHRAKCGAYCHRTSGTCQNSHHHN